MKFPRNRVSQKEEEIHAYHLSGARANKKRVKRCKSMWQECSHTGNALRIIPSVYGRPEFVLNENRETGALAPRFLSMYIC